MAKISVYLKNNLLQSLKLDEKRTYFAGRADSCDIVLPPDKGISRQHFKLTYQLGSWRLDVLSKFGELYLEGQKVGQLEMKTDTVFEVPPYRFVFHAQAVSVPVSSSDEKTVIVPSIRDGADDLEFSDERTMIVKIQAVGQLRLLDDRGETAQVYRLEGDSWVAGRETNCSIFLDNPKISRKQFEIYRSESTYFIRDSGSSNGTLVNAQPLSRDNWAPLNSGDVIQILDWTLQFEIRDSEYEKRLQEAGSLIESPLPMNYDEQGLSEPQMAQQQNFSHPTIDMPAMLQKKFKWSRQNIFRAGIGLLAIVIVGSFAFDDEPAARVQQQSSTGNTKDRKPASAQSKAFESLTPAQQDYIKESFRLSKEFFMEGRYEMSRQEIIKIHQIVPAFEDSQALLKDAEVAIRLKQDKEMLENKQREREEIEQKISRQVAICSEKLSPEVEQREIEDCLSSVVQFNPEHPKIQEIRSKLDQLLTEKSIRAAQRKDVQEKMEQLRALFEKGQNLKRAGKSLEAMRAFKGVQSSTANDPNNYRAKAKQEIVSLAARIRAEQVQLESDAEAAHKRGELKTALETLRKASALDPENATIPAKIKAIITEHHKQMQIYYQEGILEESVGEVETAKNKWKKIVEQSFPEEEYYKKATLKLKKYGAN